MCVLFALAGCDGVFGLDRLPPVIDGAVDAAMPDFAPFDTPVPFEELNSNTIDEDATLTADLLEVFFARNGDLWTATRESVDSAWSSPVQATELNTSNHELRPSISSDGLTIYFVRSGTGAYHIYYATRVSRGSEWSTPILLSLDLYEPNTAALPGWLSPDGLMMFVERISAEERAIFVATRDTPNADFVTERFEGIDFGITNGAPWATPDRSRLVFASNRSGRMSIWEAAEVGGTWILHRHTELDVARVRGTPWLSPDGRMIVFAGTSSSGTDGDLYFATR